MAGGNLEIAEQELLYRNHIREKVIQIAATDEQLKKALFFIYPSLYGFGIPILEAFKNGCPVLLSDASCFPEIAGNAAAYFEALSLDSLISEMKKLLESTNKRKNLIEKGNEQLTFYSMESCVSNTIETYKRLF